MRISVLLTVALAVAGTSTSVHAQDATAKATDSWNLGIKAGLYLGGEMTVDTGSSFDVDTEAGGALTASIDATVAARLSVGLFAFAARSETGAGDGFSIGTLGAAIKGRFVLGNAYQLRPGLHIGYQRISTPIADASTGLEIGGLLELAIPSAGGREWLAEIGFITQPAGGNDEFDLTFGPIFYLSAGIGFGG